jgi:GTP1/Obg family GTP-binding protein
MLTDVSEVRAASIIRAMMEVARTYETSVDIQLRTRQYIPEDSELDYFYYHLVSVVMQENKFRTQVVKLRP